MNTNINQKYSTMTDNLIHLLNDFEETHLLRDTAPGPCLQQKSGTMEKTGVSNHGYIEKNATTDLH